MRESTRKVVSKERGRAARVFALGLIVAGLIGWTPAGLRAGARGQKAPASSGESLDTILKDLAGYDFAVGVGAPMRLKAYVLAHKDDPVARKDAEARLLAFIESGATAGGRMEACRSLSLIGSAAAVPVLGKLLRDSETTDMVRYALERIPGPEAEAALLAALDETEGDVRLGIIFSLGARSDASVPALESLARGRDRDAAAAAVQSLGRIGGDEASRVLSSLLLRGAREPLRSEIFSAQLAAAERFLREGRKPQAAALYNGILTSSPPSLFRGAAFKGKISATEADVDGLILGALSGDDSVLHEAAIAEIPEVFGPEDIGRITPYLGKLPEAGEIQLLRVLAGYPASAVSRDIAAALESPSEAVRREALRSLGRAGDAGVVGSLAGRAATTKGVEQTLAREALWRLKGADVDEAVSKNLAAAEDEAVRAELVQAVGERRIKGAKPGLVGIIKSGPAAVRLRAIRALRDISSQEDIELLMELLFGLQDETAREEMQNTIAAVARANPREVARGDLAEARLSRESDPRKKADLLRLLGKIGDDSALPLVRSGLSDPDPAVRDAAVRALADWPTNAARDDLERIARTTSELNHKVLAIRAYVRAIGLEPFRAPEAVVGDILKILALDPRPEEKRLVLGLLARYPCPEALKAAESLVSDESVRKEATLAVERIRTALANKR